MQIHCVLYEERNEYKYINICVYNADLFYSTNFSPRVPRLCPVSKIFLMLRTYLQLNTPLLRRIEGLADDVWEPSNK